MSLYSYWASYIFVVSQFYIFNLFLYDLYRRCGAKDIPSKLSIKLKVSDSSHRAEPPAMAERHMTLRGVFRCEHPEDVLRCEHSEEGL